MKTSAQITITPRLLVTLEKSLFALERTANDTSVLAEAKKEGVSGEVCRGAIADNLLDQAALAALINVAKTALNK